ncbi:LacI family DNA-binding transcriptional regulator [Gephyromycinifex aptenodytis]|uniref:LacI family DNA-binding transcriptional regulator n=1 Tax=Gephyromycinifex aptenodytis TaxID=2716227 RepID=UPI0014450932|nr:LacI family DNA-binding transcriptional regulator [Gephyromycinifex aptenodytis]
MVNISDVAQRLGVSRSTVSYALSGKRPISEETKERVHAAIREMDFWPSAAGRALATASTQILAVLAPMAANATPEVALQFVNGVVQASRACGYDVLLVTGDESFRSVQRLVRAKQVDGFIVLDVEEHDPRTKALQDAGAVATLVGMPPEAGDLDRVDVDWGEAGALLIAELAKLGHRSICLLGAPEAAHKLGMTYAARFRNGVRDAADSSDVRVVEVAAVNDFFETVRTVESLMARHPEMTAFVVQHEAATAPLFSALSNAGAQVPLDYSVVGVSIDKLGLNFAPPVSGVRNPSSEMTRAAVEMLVDRLQHPARDAQTLLLRPEYADHGTTAPSRTT